MAPAPVDLDGVERRAGRDERPAVGPAQDVDRRRLGGRRRVRERQDDRPVGPGGHRAKDRFVERAAHPGRPDQDGRADALDRLDEARELGREAVVGEGRGRAAPARASWRRGPRAGRGPVPCESTRTRARRTAASSIPSSSIARRTRRAIPIPAAPAPTSTTRVPRGRTPRPRRPARTPATTTAAVPWMSSLKDGTRSR